MATLNETPAANRLHIGIFGKTNSGKSTFINVLTNQEVSIVSPEKGTTTDPVYKAMELNPIGPISLIDTAGFDDDTSLGASRMEKTRLAAEKTELAVMLFSLEDGVNSSEIDLEKYFSSELEWINYFKEKSTPVLCVITKSDLLAPSQRESLSEWIKNITGQMPLVYSSEDEFASKTIKEALSRKIPEEFDCRDITGSLVHEDDLVLLVMPQDIQAPKGRLILPQVQTIRELLDKKATVVAVTTDKFVSSLSKLVNPPKLIVTDSQVFDYVYENKPKEAMLTSFSVLFAAYKGDLPYYIEGAKAIDGLNALSRVLIAECCTHAPLQEDIGRVKLPNMLRKRFGDSIQIDHVSGTDFPEELSKYNLIIQCGGCMFNRKYILSRVDKAKAANIPMTNYGATIAHLTGILEKVSLP